MQLSPTLSKFVGTWRRYDQPVEYTISLQNDSICVTGIDTDDGEVLEIRDISFTDTELRFTSICPSTVFALKHIFRSVLGDQIEHEFTRVENWLRKIDAKTAEQDAAANP